MIIYFVRHGQAENPEDIVYGRLPGFPLSQKGRAATATMARTVFADKKIAAIYYSPLQRTQETAQLIQDNLRTKPKPPLIADQRLLEAESVFAGEPAEKGLRQSGRKENLAAWLDRYVKEPVTEIQARVLSLVQDAQELYPDQAVIFVSHADTMGPALCALLGEPIPKHPIYHIRKCSVHEVTFNGTAKSKLIYQGA